MERSTGAVEQPEEVRQELGSKGRRRGPYTGQRGFGEGTQDAGDSLTEVVWGRTNSSRWKVWGRVARDKGPGAGSGE